MPDLFRPVSKSAEDASSPAKGYFGQYFGQSSFSSYTHVNSSSVVSVKGIVETEEDLKMLAPLGCGLQTGAGAITNIAAAGKWDDVVVLGLGGVGLAAVMVRLFLFFSLPDQTLHFQVKSGLEAKIS